MPFNLNSLRALFPESRADDLERSLIGQYGLGARVPILKLRECADKELRYLADYVFERFFLGYTLKQWGLGPSELDSSVTERVPISVSCDDRYFHDTYQAMP